MRKFWVGILLLLVLLLTAGGAYLYDRYGFFITDILTDTDSDLQNLTRVEAVKLGVTQPQELKDSTTVAPIFRVVEVGANDAVWRLAYLWPKEKEGERLSAIVSCNSVGNFIYNSGNNFPRIASAKNFINTMRNRSVDSYMFRGKCADDTCSSINSRCDLILTDSTKYEN